MNKYIAAATAATIFNADRNNPVICAACRRRFARKSRQQKFCSDRCRDFARREELTARSLKTSARYPYSGQPTNPPKKESIINGLQRRKMGSSLFANAPLNVLGGGSFRWPETPRLEARTLENILSSEIGAAP
jgi:hypothetical protein